jgi:hydrogenase maturation protein HypF
MERRSIAVHGVVQGVGFRPFVYGLASRLGLQGFVKNQTGGVLIEVEGDGHALDTFLSELTARPPPLARIERLCWERQTPRGEQQFRIEPSKDGAADAVFVATDVATCEECLAELLDPANRRYLYPFLNCTNCGPRLTIITGAPYDRQRTTMARFRMCSACQAEYEDPHDRRFHAQPTACPVCGPRLQALNGEGRRIETADPLGLFAAKVLAGSIGALKGLGGYHIVCDARNAAAVAELRRRKHRDEKPFAIMVGDLAPAEALCEVRSGEKELLSSARRPIVLLRKRPSTGVAEAVAPGNSYLGIMLPYTALHHLLLRAAGEVPLVMTSGNCSDEPIAYEEEDALRRLAGIADWFLTHDRPIHVRCDDSVTRLVSGRELLVRRSRGYAPEPIPLPLECPVPILAVGGQLKGTFALGRGRHAFLSHHLGDLDHYDAYRAYVKDIALFEQLFAVAPEVIAHDLHPDYASTCYALERAQVLPDKAPARLIALQHHHAHLASCMAENGLAGPVIGVIFDGAGFGTDGTIWGGEFLVGDYRHFRRAAHLRYVGMPGGEQAVRQPWRMAVAHLRDADVEAPLLTEHLPPVALRTVEKMLEKGFNTPLTSSVGRLFDAVAALAGIRENVSYEGQAAMELEWLATGAAPEEGYPFGMMESATGGPSEATLIVDTRPLIRAVAADAARPTEGARIARRFHSTMVEIVAAVCNRIREPTGNNTVVLSGGVFLNALLTREVSERLAAAGFQVYRHRLVPPNDGGLSLGQLAIAAARCSGPEGSATPKTCQSI